MGKLFLTVGAVVLWLGCLWFIGLNTLVVRFTGERTTGTVVTLDKYGTKHAVWSFPIETYPDGTQASTRASQQYMLFPPEVGETATIIFDPEDPQHQVAFGDFPGPFELLSLAGIAFGALLWWGLHRTEHPAKPAPAGKPPRERWGTPDPVVRARARREDRRRGDHQLHHVDQSSAGKIATTSSQQL